MGQKSAEGPTLNQERQCSSKEGQVEKLGKVPVEGLVCISVIVLSALYDAWH